MKASYSATKKVIFQSGSHSGFYLENKMFHTNGFGFITLGSNVRDLVALFFFFFFVTDLVALTNEALSISIIKKNIIDTNYISFHWIESN